MSSRLAFPQAASPDRSESPRKKRKIDVASTREPLQDIINDSSLPTRRLAGFVADDNTDDEDHGKETGSKNTSRYSTSSFQESTNTDTQIGTACDIQEEAEALSQMQHSPDIKDNSIHSLHMTCTVRDCSGKTRLVGQKLSQLAVPYQLLVAERSTIEPGCATKSYYGIDIHRLIDDAKKDFESRQALAEVPTPDPIVETVEEKHVSKLTKSLLWTEKYRARKFTDLVGDERTHRSVLRWLKGWDPIVFPRQVRPKPKQGLQVDDQDKDRTHRKILLLTGPPGLGKTTLAHVCAKQAGYEVQEINASDERSSSVVRGRIRDMLATENVRSVESGLDSKKKKTARPVCIIVDEVDGVVSGSGGTGEGGFIKALVDLLALDQRNRSTSQNTSTTATRKRKGDRFQMLRPLILVCNDVYHPSLRLLRQGTIAELVHVRKPPIQMVAPRLQAIFTQEGIPCDSDGVRALCEAAWGMSSRKDDRSQDGGTGDGDMRSILITGEWVAGKLKAAQLSTTTDSVRLSKKWFVQNVLNDLSHGGGAARSLGRGGSKEILERIFLHNAGFSTAIVVDAQTGTDLSSTGDMKQALTARETGRNQTMSRLTQMIHASGEDDRIMSDVWIAYPSNPFQDDTLLTKPSQAYDWLHFHALCSEKVRWAQEWELAPYLSYPVLAFHHLFAGNSRNKTLKSYAVTEDDVEREPVHPLTTNRAPYFAQEAQRANNATLAALHATLSHSLQRSFRGPEDLATDLVPYLLRILNPDVKPVVIGGSDKGITSVRKGSEKDLVNRSVQAMLATGVRFEKTRIEFAADAGSGVSNDRTAQAAGFVYRMEPCIDDLGTFATAGNGLDTGSGGKVRYAVRQVLEQEHRHAVAQVERDARQRRAGIGITFAGYDSRSVASIEDLNLEVLAHQARADAVALAKTKAEKLVKRDFFGRPVTVQRADEEEVDASRGLEGAKSNGKAVRSSGIKDQDSESGRVWVTFHEGYSNAVRKGITMAELLSGL